MFHKKPIIKPTIKMGSEIVPFRYSTLDLGIEFKAPLKCIEL